MVSLIKKDMLIEEYFVPSVSISSGTAGTYATNTSISTAKTGYKAVTVAVSILGHPANYRASAAFANANKLAVTVSFYRTSTSAYDIPAGDCAITVWYNKE